MSSKQPSPAKPIELRNTTSTATATTTTSSTFKSLALFVAVAAITLALLPALRSSLSKLFSSPSASPPLAKNIMSATTTTTSTSATTTPGGIRIQKRPWNLRGKADYGWLYSFHTFSFASYYDRNHEGFGPLRVINEDRVERGTGFGTHSHKEFLIWSYILAGELEHKDSMGNLENLCRGEVQFTSAGTGIRHSEYNRNDSEDVHFLQIWVKPNIAGLTPSYKTRNYPDALKEDKLLRIMESVNRHSGKDEETQPIPLQADFSTDVSILAPGKKVVHEIVKDGARSIYLHVVMSGRTQPKEGGAKIKVNDVVLGEGDGAYIRGASGPGQIEIESVGDTKAEFLLFDMGTEST